MRNTKSNPKIMDALDELQSFPPRDPATAARGEAAFLKRAAEIGSAVSREQKTGPMIWISAIGSIFRRKENTPMLKPLFAAVIAVMLFFGGTGATVYAAQGSQPDQTLYPVKTWSEDALVSLAGTPRSRLNYDLDFSDRRIMEIAGLLSAGNPIPEMVVTRLQIELQQALELAAGMDDPQMLQQLEQIRLRAEAQLRKMNGLMSDAPESAQPALLKVRTRIQQQVQLATMGKMDPQGFKMQVQQQGQYQNGSGGQTPKPENRQQGTALQTPLILPTLTEAVTGLGLEMDHRDPLCKLLPVPPCQAETVMGPDLEMEPKDLPYKLPPALLSRLGMAMVRPSGNQPTGTPEQNGTRTQDQECTPRYGGGSGNGP